MQVGVAAQEAGRKALVDAQHVVDHEHLPVGAAAGADADRGDRQLLRHAFGQHGGNLFEHDGEAAGLFQKTCVAHQLLGLGLFPGADGIGAELVDRLRRKP